MDQAVLAEQQIMHIGRTRQRKEDALADASDVLGRREDCALVNQLVSRRAIESYTCNEYESTRRPARADPIAPTPMKPIASDTATPLHVSLSWPAEMRPLPLLVRSIDRKKKSDNRFFGRENLTCRTCVKGAAQEKKASIIGGAGVNRYAALQAERLAPCGRARALKIDTATLATSADPSKT